MRSFFTSNVQAAPLGSIYTFVSLTTPTWTINKPLRILGLFATARRTNGTLTLENCSITVRMVQQAGAGLILNSRPQGWNLTIANSSGAIIKTFHPGSSFVPVESPVIPAAGIVNFEFEIYGYTPAVAGDTVQWEVTFYYEYTENDNDKANIKRVEVPKNKIPKIKLFKAK